MELNALSLSHECQLLIFMLLSIMFLRLFNTNSLYKNFKRADSHRFTFTPIHEVVQKGFDNVYRKIQIAIFD